MKEKGISTMNSSDIAKLANVSRSTVSRVINKYTNVPEETRKKVQAVIDQYGYTPNNSARTLAGKTNNIIGLFIADIPHSKEDEKWVGVTSPYTTEILSHVIKIAKKRGYLTLVDTISEEKSFQDMEIHLSNRMLHGGIFLGFPYRTKELEEMAEKGYNVVLIDQLSQDDDAEKKIKRVNTDNVLGGFLATEHLIQNGHKKLLHVAGDHRLSAVSREKGFLAACEKYNIQDYHIIYGLYSENTAYNVVKNFLENNEVTGIFAANDVMALGILRASKELHLSVPDDISIIGFDNLKWAEWLSLQLSSMFVPKEDIAEAAIELLLSDKQEHICTPMVVKGNSVAPI